MEHMRDTEIQVTLNANPGVYLSKGKVFHVIDILECTPSARFKFTVIYLNVKHGRW